MVLSAVRFLPALFLLSVMAAGASPLQEASSRPRTTTSVNLNTATAADLEALPGVGARVAQRIVDYRAKHGPFRRVEDVMNVQGIGEKSFLKLKPMLVVAPPAKTDAKGDAR